MHLVPSAQLIIDACFNIVEVKRTYSPLPGPVTVIINNALYGPYGATHTFPYPRYPDDSEN